MRVHPKMELFFKEVGLSISIQSLQSVLSNPFQELVFSNVSITNLYHGRSEEF